MNLRQYFIYLFIMVVSTYLIRALPFALIKKKIKNRFIQSFLYYVPFAVLTAMTIPDVFLQTGSIVTASCGFFVAVLLALLGKELTVVALASCLAVIIAQYFV